MKSSTKDRLKGRLGEAKGKLKEKAGRATRDPDMQDRGTAEKLAAKSSAKSARLRKYLENSRYLPGE